MADPEDSERGRYLAIRTGPHSMTIHRATELCETCRNCGCGAQQEPIDLSPGGIMKLMSAAKINPLQMLGMARAGARDGG